MPSCIVSLGVLAYFIRKKDPNLLFTDLVVWSQFLLWSPEFQAPRKLLKSPDLFAAIGWAGGLGGRRELITTSFWSLVLAHKFVTENWLEKIDLSVSNIVTKWGPAEGSPDLRRSGCILTTRRWLLRRSTTWNTLEDPNSHRSWRAFKESGVTFYLQIPESI
jgi:hypothetical protein